MFRNHTINIPLYITFNSDYSKIYLRRILDNIIISFVINNFMGIELKKSENFLKLNNVSSILYTRAFSFIDDLHSKLKN